MYIAAPDNRQMSASGLNLLRIVLSSYFIGTSLGLITGTNITVLAHLVMPSNLAEFIANTGVFILAYLVLMGVWLRPAALLLAGYVLASSGFATFVADGSATMSEFWRDVALMAGLMMTYLNNNARKARSEAVIRRDPQVRTVNQGEQIDLPRRVEPLRKAKTETAETKTALREDADVINIFAA